MSAFGWIGPDGKIFYCEWARHGEFAIDSLISKRNKIVKLFEQERAVKHLLSKGWVKFQRLLLSDSAPIQFEHRYKEEDIPNKIIFAMGKIIKDEASK